MSTKYDRAPVAPCAWSERHIAALRELWAAGMSSAQIALRLGTTKNAVVGKAHRLHLAPRPNPVGRETWTPEIVERVRALAALPTGEIARRVGMHPSSIAAGAKRHGIDLPDRRPGNPARRRHIPLPLSAALPRDRASAVEAGPRDGTPELFSRASGQLGPAAAPVAAGPLFRTCQWPLWKELRSASDIRFCARPITQLGRSYCADCHARAYRPVPRPFVAELVA